MGMTAANKIYGPAVSMSDVHDSRTVRSWTAGLFLTGILGALSGICGLGLGSLAALNVLASSSAIYATGTILIGASFVLFGVAAHCIDKAGAAVKAARLERCRRNGLKN